MAHRKLTCAVLAGLLACGGSRNGFQRFDTLPAAQQTTFKRCTGKAGDPPYSSRAKLCNSGTGYLPCWDKLAGDYADMPNEAARQQFLQDDGCPASVIGIERPAPKGAEHTAGPVLLKEIYPYCIVILPNNVFGDPPLSEDVRKGCANGNVACQIEVVTGSGDKEMTGSAYLCTGGSRDATALTKKMVMLTVVPGRIQDPICDYNPKCPHGSADSLNREENLVKSIAVSPDEPAASAP